MTTDQDKDDAQWLATLAGQKKTSVDPVVQAQAEALRHALQVQSQRMDTRVPLADDAHYQQLLFRLRREGVVDKTNPLAYVVTWGQTQGQVAVRAMASHSTLVWVIAACVVLVIGVALQSNQVSQGSVGPDRRLILRSQGTVLIVPDPQARASELLTGLRAVGAEPAVLLDDQGQVRLQFLANAAAFDYLSAQRIEPQIVDGWVTLTLVLPQQKTD
jgi:hypothetical protein